MRVWDVGMVARPDCWDKLFKSVDNRGLAFAVSNELSETREFRLIIEGHGLITSDRKLDMSDA